MREATPTLTQQEFLAKEKQHKTQVRIIRVFLFVLFLAVWELCARLEIIDAFIFGSPSRIGACFIRMTADGSIFLHIGVTLYETVVSFFLVVTIAVAVAVGLWASRTASEVLESYLVMLNSLPKSALAPLLIVWLGIT